MTVKEQRDYTKMYVALCRIKSYQTPQFMRRHSQRDWGCDYDDAIEMAYENLQFEARNGIKGVRKPKF